MNKNKIPAYITIQAIYMHTKYEANDILLMYSVMTEAEKIMVDKEYQRLRLLRLSDERMFTSLALYMGVLVDISCNKKTVCSH